MKFMIYQKNIKLINKIALGLILILIPFANLLCQNVSKNISATIFTERSFYVTGEQIGIKVLLPDSSNCKSQEYSLCRYYSAGWSNTYFYKTENY